MKRLLILLIIAVMMVTFVAYAKTDLSSLSDAELIQLNEDLIKELVKRGKQAKVPVGEYVIGTHIPAGEYRVLLDGADTFNMSMVMTYKAKGGGLKDMYTLAEGVEEIGRLELTDGMEIHVSAGGVILIPLLSAMITFK